MKTLTKKEFIEKLQQRLKENHEWFLNLKEEAGFENSGLLKQYTAVHRTILYKSGYRESTSENKKEIPPKDFFKKKHVILKDTPEVKEIKNENINTGAFKKKDLTEFEESNVIQNEIPNNDVLKPNPSIDIPLEKKATPKRLNAKQVKRIGQLANEGYSAEDISDKLLLNLEKVKIQLKRLKKKEPKNLLATSDKKTTKFEEEIKEHQKNNK